MGHRGRTVTPFARAFLQLDPSSLHLMLAAVGSSLIAGLVIEVVHRLRVVLCELVLGNVVDPGLDHGREQRAACLPPDRLRDLEPGDAIGVLDDGSHYDIYTFSGPAGQRVRITLRSDDFDAFLARAQQLEAGGQQGLDGRRQLGLALAPVLLAQGGGQLRGWPS